MSLLIFYSCQRLYWISIVLHLGRCGNIKIIHISNPEPWSLNDRLGLNNQLVVFDLGELPLSLVQLITRSGTFIFKKPNVISELLEFLQFNSFVLNSEGSG